jgi:hypothetical protein
MCLQFPDYDKIIANPMNLARMEKHNSGGRYDSVAAVLLDVQVRPM